MGMFLGFFIGFFLGALIIDIAGIWLTFTVIAILLGLGVGVLQWLVLRKRVSRAGWWVLASAAGGTLLFQNVFEGIYWSLEGFGALLSWIGVVALGGAVTGTLQWLVLRGQVSRAGWWILASTVGWVLSAIVTGSIPWGVDDGSGFAALVVIGAVMGALTGAALVWLLRQPVPET
jgi:hypothetical protein